MEYTIRELSEKTHLSANTLRYYEKEGLLPDIKRTKGGIRRYSEENLEWLSLITCLKNTGMSIKQISQFVDLSLQGPESLKARCELLIAHKKEIELHIEEMNHYYDKVNCKIEHFTQQYKQYTDQNGEAFC